MNTKINKYKFFSRYLTNTITKTVVVSVLLALLLTGFVFIKNHASYSDFVSLVVGAEILKSEDRNMLYDIKTQNRFQQKLTTRKELLPYRNPPTSIFPFTVFSGLPIVTSYRIFVVINLLLLILGGIYLLKKFGLENKQYLLLAVFLYWPSIESTLIGQVSIGLFIVFISIFSFLKQDKFFLAGLFTSILFNKPQLLVVVPFLLAISNKKKFLQGFVLGIVCFLLLSIFLVGYKGLLKYPDFILKTESLEFRSDPASYVTLSALMYRGTVLVNWPGCVAYISSFLFYLPSLVLFWISAKKLPLEISYSVALLFMAVFSVHTWGHGLVFLLIPIFACLQQARKYSKSPFQKHLIGVALILFLLPTIGFLVPNYFFSLIMVVVGFYLLFRFKNCSHLVKTCHS